MQIARRELSLTDLPEKPDNSILLTPRSRQACMSEGIEISELVFRPIEDFADRQLSPRIVKLRYDYFEAKRKDLLALAVNAREKFLKAKPMGSTPSQSRSSSKSALTSANDEHTNWGMLIREREKLARFQEGEKRWLENCLSHELSLLRKLEVEDLRLTEENNDNSKKLIEESRRMKELNDRRRAIEEQKQKVVEAQQEVEKERAKRAFAEHQQELQRLQEKEARRKREAHERSAQEAQRRIQKETELKQQQDKLWEEKQRALADMQQQDEERLEIIDKCKSTVMEQLHARRVAKEERVLKSITKNRELEKNRKEELVKKLVADQHRDERLSIVKQQHVEETAKKSLQLMLRRKIIQDESLRKTELRRGEILTHQADLDKRLQEHEEKRRRYFDFKRELESLREKNKQLNVERQRKKEMYLRDLYAQRVVQKDAKVETLVSERQNLWELRRKTALQSQKSRDFIKKSIMEMRIKSKMNSKKLEQYVSDVLEGIGGDMRPFALINQSESFDATEQSIDITLDPGLAAEEPVQTVERPTCNSTQIETERAIADINHVAIIDEVVPTYPDIAPDEVPILGRDGCGPSSDFTSNSFEGPGIQNSADESRPDFRSCSPSSDMVTGSENSTELRFVKSQGDDSEVRFMKSLGAMETHETNN
jgi:hypothetical protein